MNTKLFCQAMELNRFVEKQYYGFLLTDERINGIIVSAIKFILNREMLRRAFEKIGFIVTKQVDKNGNLLRILETEIGNNVLENGMVFNPHGTVEFLMNVNPAWLERCANEND